MSQLTIQQAFDLALQHHQAGRLQDAEQLYRQILAQQPRHADALHFLGVIAAQAGRGDVAVDLIRQALALKPNWPDAHNNLGNVLKDKGRLDEAIAAYRQAIALKPHFPAARCNLGRTLKEKGQLDEAIAAFRQAIALKPDLAEAYSDLGSALGDKGQFDEAIAACRQAIALRPNYPEAHGNLGNALQGKGCVDEAIVAYRQAIGLRANFLEAHNNLGKVLRDKGQLDDAIAACRQAIALNPDLPEPHLNFGNALKDRGQLDEAIAAYHRAVAIKPDYPDAHNSLGVALAEDGQLDAAIAAYRQAIALKPRFPEAHSNLGTALLHKGQLDEAIAVYRQAAALAPDKAWIDSNFVYTLHFHPAYDAQTLAEEHRRWNLQHAAPLNRYLQPHPNDRSPDRRLRIGYVSPDFRDHAVGRNLLPLFRQHDRRQFDITCYAQVRRPDAMTGQFQQQAGRWRNIVGLSDEQAVRPIREDQIDILVDLALHTANNHLLLFARKPAPVQVTFAGYPGSTGLSTIDYRLSDPYLDPPGSDESVYSEQTIRLADSFWCYDPLENRAVPVNALPALTNGFVTFGCLNNFCKINDGVLRLWAQVLQVLPFSRLLLLVPDGTSRQRTLDLLAQEGIVPRRVEFRLFSRAGNIWSCTTASTSGWTASPTTATPRVWTASGWACPSSPSSVEPR